MALKDGFFGYDSVELAESKLAVLNAIGRDMLSSADFRLAENLEYAILAIGDRRVGNRYWSNYWQDVNLVVGLSINLKTGGWSITECTMVEWRDGVTRTHMTPVRGMGGGKTVMPVSLTKGNTFWR